MNQLNQLNQPVETLAPEVVAEAAPRVDAILHGTGAVGPSHQVSQGNGVAAVPIPVSPASPAPATRQTKQKKNGKGKPVSQMSADSNNRTITITLPKEVVEWFELQASQAPFEPSLQKYVAWQLRQWAAAEQAAAEKKATTAAGNQMYAAVEGANGPEIIRVPE